jgi:hypothetical protein
MVLLKLASNSPSLSGRAIPKTTPDLQRVLISALTRGAGAKQHNSGDVNQSRSGHGYE